MANLIEDGWLILSNGTDTLELACREIKWDVILNPTLDHYEGKFSLGYDLSIEFFIFQVSGILFDTNAKYKIFAAKILDWQHTSPFTLKIQRTLAGAFEYPDGTYITYTVLLQKGFAGAQKISKGDQEYYEIGKVIFEEAGVRS